jgi:hypothetical protein
MFDEKWKHSLIPGHCQQRGSPLRLRLRNATKSKDYVMGITERLCNGQYW